MRCCFILFQCSFAYSHSPSSVPSMLGEPLFFVTWSSALPIFPPSAIVPIKPSFPASFHALGNFPSRVASGLYTPKISIGIAHNIPGSPFWFSAFFAQRTSLKDRFLPDLRAFTSFLEGKQRLNAHVRALYKFRPMFSLPSSYYYLG